MGKILSSYKLLSIELDRRRFYGYSLNGKPVSRKFLLSNECKEAGTYMLGKLAVQRMSGSTRTFYHGRVRTTCCSHASNFVQYNFYPVAGNTSHLKSPGSPNLTYSALLFQSLCSLHTHSWLTPGSFLAHSLEYLVIRGYLLEDFPGHSIISLSCTTYVCFRQVCSL